MRRSMRKRKKLAGVRFIRLGVKLKKLAAVAAAAGGEKKLYLRIAIKSVFDVKKLSVPIAGNGEFLRQNRCACRPSKGIAETLLGLDGFVYGAL